MDENGPLPVNEAVDITLQIAQALVHAACRGVVHRDIKPSNIILTPQGRAKLVDMGLARRFEPRCRPRADPERHDLGTFDYISPEQARDPRDVDVRSDLYSLGCTLFQMLTGRPPFPGGTVLQKLLQHQEEPPPDIRGAQSGRTGRTGQDHHQADGQESRPPLPVARATGSRPPDDRRAAWPGASLRPNSTPGWRPRHRVTWERHLVWFFPALAFLVVVAGLVWWGREQNTPLPSEPGIGPILLPRNEVGPKDRPSPPAAPAIGASQAEDLELDPSTTVAALPRTILVRPSDATQRDRDRVPDSHHPDRRRPLLAGRPHGRSPRLLRAQKP